MPEAVDWGHASIANACYAEEDPCDGEGHDSKTFPDLVSSLVHMMMFSSRCNSWHVLLFCCTRLCFLASRLLCYHQRSMNSPHHISCNVFLPNWHRRQPCRSSVSYCQSLPSCFRGHTPSLGIHLTCSKRCEMFPSIACPDNTRSRDIKWLVHGF